MAVDDRPGEGPATAQPDLGRRARRLEYGTTAWNSLEAVVAVSTGVAGHSLALVAFGLDSCVEVLASVIVLWHLGGATEEADPARAQRAMRLIAAAFGLLGLYLLVEAGRSALTRSVSEPSGLGTVFMAATVVVMFALARAKRRTGLALDSRPLVANASMTLIDGCLAAGILVALVLDRQVGWWWADPIAAAVVGLIALNEARDNWRSSASQP
ncbi:MAG TPA: cation transporter [Acidimicrobiales bacterium]|jgi:divalent metal cation (Fe/Co/Zn/Cd) transporter|nr:cation transporter [Acidimicrobiales bacterium]